MEEELGAVAVVGAEVEAAHQEEEASVDATNLHEVLHMQVGVAEGVQTTAAIQSSQTHHHLINSIHISCNGSQTKLAEDVQHIRDPVPPPRVMLQLQESRLKDPTLIYTAPNVMGLHYHVYFIHGMKRFFFHHVTQS